MSELHITAHALKRCQERVANVTEDEARVILSSAVVRKAIDFGAHVVRLGTGQRVIIEGGSVITVLPADNYRSQVRRVGRGRYG